MMLVVDGEVMIIAEMDLSFGDGCLATIDGTVDSNQADKLRLLMLNNRQQRQNTHAFN